MSVVENKIVGMARLFPSGAAIDQVRGDQLVLWDEGFHLGSTVEYGGQTYVPASLDAQLEELLYLPTGPISGRTDQLVEELREELAKLDLEERTTLLLATTSMASWVPECTPGRILINPCGDAGTETALLDLMACLCRRTLRLAGPSLHDLARLPPGLTPTFMLNRPSQATLSRLVAAAGHPDTCFLLGGEVRQVHCTIIAYSSKPVAIRTVPALPIPLLPATGRLRRITKPEAHRLADHFQPLLLNYRLTRHSSIASSQFDVPEFGSEVRSLARVLGAALEGEANIQRQIVDTLRGLDEGRRAEQSQTPPTVVLEILLGLCHSKTPAEYVGKITEQANALFATRGAAIELSPRAVGEILRRELGLLGRRRGLGFELTFDAGAQRSIHRLAVAHGVLERVAGCPACEKIPVANPTQNHPTSGA